MDLKKLKPVNVGVSWYLPLPIELINEFELLNNFYEVEIQEKGKKIVYNKIGEFKNEK